MVLFLSKKNKNLLSIFCLVTAGAVTFGLSFIFSLSTPAQAQNATGELASILNLGENQQLTQDYDLNFEVTDEAESLELRFIDLDNSGHNKFAYAQQQSTTANVWSYHLPITELGNGSYRLETLVIFSDGTVAAGEVRNFEIYFVTTNQPVITISSPTTGSIISGFFNLLATVNQTVENLYFKITSSVGILYDFLVAQADNTARTNFSFYYDTHNLADGQYNLAVEVEDSGHTYSSEPRLFYVDNSASNNTSSTSATSTDKESSATSSQVIIFFTHPDDKALVSERVLVQARTSRLVDNLYFRVQSDYVKASVYDVNSWQAYIDSSHYKNGPLQIIAVASLSGENFYSQIMNLQVDNEIVPENDQSANSNPTFLPVKPPVSVSSEADIKQPNKAQLNLDSGSSTSPLSNIDDKGPVECQNIDIRNISCDSYLQNKATLSVECAAKVIDLDACLKQEEQRNKCRSLGFDNFDLCIRYLSEPRQSRWCYLSEFKNLPVCAGFSSSSPLSLPTETATSTQVLSRLCQEQAITDVKHCQRYLEYIDLPGVCRDKGITTASACQVYLRDNYFSSACQRLGLSDIDACQNHFVLLNKNKTVCQADDCDRLVKEKFYSQLAAQSVLDKPVTDAIKNNINKNLNFDQTRLDPDSDQAALKEHLPLKSTNQEKLRLLSADNKIRVTEGSLQQTLPAVVVYDSDGDALPDDVEKRLGTDIFNPDSDGDGYGDGEEVKNGYDPLLPAARLTKKLAPIESVLVSGVVLEQPLVSGEEAADMTISLFEPKVAEAEEKFLQFSGQGPAFSVLTLYIYSDLPLVATVQAGADGNWQYTLQDSLVDGEHRVYLAINDETGRIVKKSAPALFFVKEARAVSVDEIVNLKTTDSVKSWENYYLLGAGAMILLGLVLFFILRRNLSNNQE